MIKKEDVEAIARKAYAMGGKDAENKVHCDCEECKYPILKMVSEQWDLLYVQKGSDDGI